MTQSGMFGDLDLYKDETFFRANRTGMLILPEKVYDLEVISCMLVGASEDMIFEPAEAQDDIKAFLEFAQENAMYLNEDVLEQAKQTKKLQILALSTCSSEYTDARTIVLTVMKPHTAG
jgi:sortase B